MIDVESALGKGTTVTILLPTTDAVELGAEVRNVVVPPTSSKRILVAEDETDYRAILCAWLKHSGFDAVAAIDGQEAIDKFREDPSSFDCVLLDLSMPKRGGAEVLEALREMRSDALSCSRVGLRRTT